MKREREGATSLLDSCKSWLTGFVKGFHGPAATQNDRNDQLEGAPAAKRRKLEAASETCKQATNASAIEIQRIEAEISRLQAEVRRHQSGNNTPNHITWAPTPPQSLKESEVRSARIAVPPAPDFGTGQATPTPTPLPLTAVHMPDMLAAARSNLKSTPSTTAQAPSSARKSTLPGMPQLDRFLEEVKSVKLRKVDKSVALGHKKKPSSLFKAALNRRRNAPKLDPASIGEPILEWSSTTFTFSVSSKPAVRSASVDSGIVLSTPSAEPEPEQLEDQQMEEAGSVWQEPGIAEEYIMARAVSSDCTGTRLSSPIQHAEKVERQPISYNVPPRISSLDNSLAQRDDAVYLKSRIEEEKVKVSPFGRRKRSSEMLNDLPPKPSMTPSTLKRKRLSSSQTQTRQKIPSLNLGSHFSVDTFDVPLLGETRESSKNEGMAGSASSDKENSTGEQRRTSSSARSTWI